MTQIATQLVDRGVDESNVKYESFGGKSTGPGAIRVGKAADPNSQQSWRVELVDSSLNADWNGEYESLLDFAEDQNVSIDSSCRSGSCGSCLVRCKSGAVTYVEEPTCEPESDQVVMCVAKPKTDLQLYL